MRRALARAALLAAPFFPLFRLARQGFWYDELFTVWVARQSVPEIVRQASADGFTPPLYYLLVHSLWRLGLRTETLRLLSLVGAAALAWGLLALGRRAVGRRGAWTVFALTCASPFYFWLAQELRPYSAAAACGTWAVEAWLRWRERGAAGVPIIATMLAVAASAFSYLGLALWPPLLLLAGRRGRRAVLAVAVGSAVAITASWPGLRIAALIAGPRAAQGRAQIESRPMFPLARLMLAQATRMPPLADAAEERAIKTAEILGGLSIVGAALLAVVRRDAALGVSLAAFGYALVCVWAADAVVGLGITTRYLTLAFPPFALAWAILLTRAGSRGHVLCALVGLAELAATGRALFDSRCQRDDWRGVLAFVSERRGERDLVLGFPFHHLDVAASFYAPGLPRWGGSVDREGRRVELAPAGGRFEGYGASWNLVRASDAAAELARAAAGRRVFLVTYSDDDWHGDTRPIADALARDRLVFERRFPGREILRVRLFVPRSMDDGLDRFHPDLAQPSAEPMGP